MDSEMFLNDRIFFYEKQNIKHKKAVEFAFRDMRKLQYQNLKRLYPQGDKNFKEEDLPF